MRLTSKRKQILHILQNGGAYTASKIHDLLKDELDLATVYRTLNLFLEEGIVEELKLLKGESMFEIIEDDHQHAVCKNCGKVLHLHMDMDNIKKNINIDGFEVEDVEIVVKGQCINL